MLPDCAENDRTEPYTVCHESIKNCSLDLTGVPYHSEISGPRPGRISLPPQLTHTPSSVLFIRISRGTNDFLRINWTMSHSYNIRDHEGNRLVHDKAVVNGVHIHYCISGPAEGPAVMLGRGPTSMIYIASFLEY